MHAEYEDFNQWFKISNYESFIHLSEEHLDFEIRQRKRLFNLIEEYKADIADPYVPETSDRLPIIPDLFLKVLKGEPCFTKSFNIVEQKKLKEIGDIGDQANFEYITQYQIAKKSNPVRYREGLSLRSGHEILWDCQLLKDFVGDLIFLHAGKHSNRLPFDFIANMANFSELPIRDRSGNLLDGTNISLSLNIKDFTNEELTEKLNHLLNELRYFYDCPEPKRDKKRRKDDVQKLLDYRVLALLDAELWRELISPNYPTNKIVTTVLFGSEYGEKAYYNTIKPFISKVLEEHYTLV